MKDEIWTTSAKDFGPFLEKNGFLEIHSTGNHQTDVNAHVFKVVDVIVFEGCENHDDGHI